MYFFFLIKYVPHYDAYINRQHLNLKTTTNIRSHTFDWKGTAERVFKEHGGRKPGRLDAKSREPWSHGAWGTWRSEGSNPIEGSGSVQAKGDQCLVKASGRWIYLENKMNW